MADKLGKKADKKVKRSGTLVDRSKLPVPPPPPPEQHAADKHHHKKNTKSEAANDVRRSKARDSKSKFYDGENEDSHEPERSSSTFYVQDDLPTENADVEPIKEGSLITSLSDNPSTKVNSDSVEEGDGKPCTKQLSKSPKLPPKPRVSRPAPPPPKRKPGPSNSSVKDNNPPFNAACEAKPPPLSSAKAKPGFIFAAGTKPLGPPPPIPSKPPVGIVPSNCEQKDRASTTPVPPVRRSRSLKLNDKIVLKTQDSLGETVEKKSDAPETSEGLDIIEEGKGDKSESLNKTEEKKQKTDIPEKSECIDKTEQNNTDISEKSESLDNTECHESDIPEELDSPVVPLPCEPPALDNKSVKQVENVIVDNQKDNVTETKESTVAELDKTVSATSGQEQIKDSEDDCSSANEPNPEELTDNVVPDNYEPINHNLITGDKTGTSATEDKLLSTSGNKSSDINGNPSDIESSVCDKSTETVAVNIEREFNNHNQGTVDKVFEENHESLPCSLQEEKYARSEHLENSETGIKSRLHILRSSKNSRETLYPPVVASGGSSERALHEPEVHATKSVVDNKKKSSTIHSIMREKIAPKLHRHDSATCNSFTTEDKDLFFEITKSASPNHSPVVTIRGDVTRKKDGQHFVPRDRAVPRRRSKSVGEADYSSKPLQFSKPMIAVKPKPRIPRKSQMAGSQASRVGGGIREDASSPNSSPDIKRKILSPSVEAVKPKDHSDHSSNMSPEKLKKHIVQEAVPTKGLSLSPISKPKVPKRKDMPTKVEEPVMDENKTSPFGVKLKHIEPQNPQKADSGHEFSSETCIIQKKKDLLKVNYVKSDPTHVNSPKGSSPMPARRPRARPPTPPKSSATESGNIPADEQSGHLPTRPIRKNDAVKKNTVDMLVTADNVGEKTEQYLQNANSDSQDNISENNESAEIKEPDLGKLDAKQESVCDSLNKYDEPEVVDRQVVEFSDDTIYSEVPVQEDIYETVIDGIVCAGTGGTSPPPLPPPNPKPLETADNQSGKISREERKLQRKLSRKASIARRLARKQSRKESIKRKRNIATSVSDPIYSTIDENAVSDDEDENFEDFSDSESGSWSENSLTDDSDLEYEAELKDELRYKQSIYGCLPVRNDPDVPDFVPKDDCHKIVHELLTTEKSYVNKLHLIDQIFHFKVVIRNRSDKMFPPDVIPKMFSNIKSIYQFHNDFLLPQLESRFEKWEEVPKIGDLIKDFAPFLKIYSEYIKNYDTANETIAFWQEKSPLFADLIEELQKKPECGSIRLLDHMLGPIQRIPRYEMLLKDYLKHLPEDSPDKADTLVALDLVVKAASHSNDAIRKIDKFRKLLEISECLIGEIDLILPGRELIKEGKITKISGRKGEQFERYLFLFNDMLLVCQNVSIVGLKHQYKIKAKLDVEGMRVMEGDNMGTSDTFHVKGKQKSVELLASSSEEKDEWQTTLWNVISEFTKKQLSRHGNLSESLDKFSDSELGKRAPTWIRDKDTSMCMQCSVGFTMYRRRHHCRACGIVVCHGCSTYKSKLAYDNDKENRVCAKCFQILEGKSEEIVPSHLQAKRQVLKVKASDPAVLSGYLSYSTDKKTWNRRWLSARDDFVLFFFKAHQDVVAEASLPLPGFSLKEVKLAPRSFKLYYQGQTGAEKEEHFFQADDNASCNRWIEVFSKLVLLELPPSTSTPRSSASNS